MRIASVVIASGIAELFITDSIAARATASRRGIPMVAHLWKATITNAAQLMCWKVPLLMQVVVEAGPAMREFSTVLRDQSIIDRQLADFPMDKVRFFLNLKLATDAAMFRPYLKVSSFETSAQPVQSILPLVQKSGPVPQ